MNKYQEALDDIKQNTRYRYVTFKDSSLTTLQELVDKETLYSLSYEGDGYDPTDGELVYDTAICKCGRHFEIEYEEHYKYCPNCGRKLDWSECDNE